MSHIFALFSICLVCADGFGYVLIITYSLPWTLGEWAMKNSDCSNMIDMAMIDKTPRNEAFSVAKLDYQKSTKKVDKWEYHIYDWLIRVFPKDLVEHHQMPATKTAAEDPALGNPSTNGMQTSTARVGRPIHTLIANEFGIPFVMCYVVCLAFASSCWWKGAVFVGFMGRS